MDSYCSLQYDIRR